MSLETPADELPSDLVGPMPDGLTEDPFDRLTRMASRLLSAPVALIAFAEAGHFKLRSQLGLGLGGRDLPASLCAATAESGEPLLLADAKADPRFSRDPAVTGPPHLRAFAGVPLLGPDGAIAGVFCVLDRSPRPFTHEQVKTLKYLAAIAEDELAKIARISGGTAPVSLPPPAGGGTDESADVGELRQLFASHDTSVFLHASIEHGMRSLITGVNEAGCDLLGYTRNSLLQHSFVDLFYQSQPEWLEEIDRMLDGQCDVVFKIALRSALGAPVPVEINTRLLGAGSPVPAYTIVTRLADEHSDSLGEEGPPIAELAGGLLCRFTPDGTLTFVNDAYCEYNGEDRENLEGFIFRPLTIEEDRGISEAAIAAIKPDHPVAACEYRVYGRDGRPGWQRWVYTGMFDASGNVLEYQAVGNGFRPDAPETPAAAEMVAEAAPAASVEPSESSAAPPARPVVEHFETPPDAAPHSADESRESAPTQETVAADVESFVEASHTPLPGTPALDETWDMQVPPPAVAPTPQAITPTPTPAPAEDSATADERFRLLMQASHDGIWDWNLQARHGYFSPRWKEMLGYADAELQDHPRTFFRLLNPEDRPAVWSAIRTHLQRRDPFTFTARFRHKDGSYRWIFCRGDSQRNAEGQPVRMLGIHTDVTNLKRTEEALRVAKEAAENADRSKNEFLAVMSHEIRTPMNGILGFTDLLLGTELQDEQRDYLQTIKASSDSLMSLLSDILDLARIEAGGLEFENRPFALGEFMEETVAAHRAKAEEKALQVNLRLDANTPDTIVTDPTKLRQILNNLINNAIKFTAQGHVDLTVLAIGKEGPATSGSAELPLYSLEFRVSDTGIGIQAERLDRLFRPFSQADTSTTRRFGGMGLGLVIAQRLCSLMGGSIKARSDVGKGSVFTFNLALPGEKRGDAVEDFTGNGQSDSDSGSRLLVAEDNPVNQKLIRAMLKRLGLVADYALNGLEVLEMNSRRQPYEIIFMDVHMPAMDGLMATRRIRELERENPDRPKSYIIALTADAMPGDRELCLEAGVDDYLTKPFKQSDLSQAMERAQELARPA
jgi:PAS domain S-box-containing protein